MLPIVVMVTIIEGCRKEIEIPNAQDNHSFDEDRWMEDAISGSLLKDSEYVKPYIEFDFKLCMRSDMHLLCTITTMGLISHSTVNTGAMPFLHAGKDAVLIAHQHLARLIASPLEQQSQPRLLINGRFCLDSEMILLKKDGCLQSVLRTTDVVP